MPSFNLGLSSSPTPPILGESAGVGGVDDGASRRGFLKGFDDDEAPVEEAEADLRERAVSDPFDDGKYF